MSRRPFAAPAALLLVPVLFAPGPARAQESPAVPQDAAVDAKAAGEVTSESWQLMKLGGDRIGYAHVTTRREGGGEDAVLVSDTDVKMTFSRFGMAIRMGISQTTRETPGGELLAVDMSMTNPPADATKLHAVRDGDVLKTEWTMGENTTSGEVELGDDVKSPAFQERFLTENPLEPGESASFKMFVAELGKVATVTIEAEGKEMVELLDGTRRELDKFTVTQDLVPIPTHTYQDADGRTLVTKMDLMGQEMRTYEVSAEEALEDVVVGDLDIGFGTLVDAKRPDGTPVAEPHRSGRALTYRVTLPDGDPSALFPTGDTQTVKKLSDHVAEVTVKGLPVPHGPAASAEEFTVPTRYLQCDDAGVVRHARAASGGLSAATDAGAVASAMEGYVDRTLTDKNMAVAMAGAAEVARDLSGDCTEHSVLLAAMLRAERIPARVCVGFVMIPGRGQMGGHMWTEAKLTTPDGPKWVPLDATLGEGGIGGGHLKMGDSSLADEAAAPITSFLPMLELLGKVRLEVVAVDGERLDG